MSDNIKQTKPNHRIIRVQNGRDLEIHEFYMPDDVDDEWDLIWFHILDNGHIGEHYALIVYKDFFDTDGGKIIDILAAGSGRCESH